MRASDVFILALCGAMMLACLTMWIVQTTREASGAALWLAAAIVEAFIGAMIVARVDS